MLILNTGLFNLKYLYPIKACALTFRHFDYANMFPVHSPFILFCNYSYFPGEQQLTLDMLWRHCLLWSWQVLHERSRCLMHLQEVWNPVYEECSPSVSSCPPPLYVTGTGSFADQGTLNHSHISDLILLPLWTQTVNKMDYLVSFCFCTFSSSTAKKGV